ncbi:hypothetical protein [Streptomyces sp. NPDC086010]|uniref:hypothetical protein n=1 Tax=Streptomyces sp. NPDC086010 TaxID=3365745 RepID=UPI0037D90F93
MIPAASIDVDASFPASFAMGLPDEDEIDEEGYGTFRDVWTIGEVGHEEAIRMIETERRLVGLVDQASRTAIEFETMARAVETGEVENLPDGYVTENPHSDIVQFLGAVDEEQSTLDALELGVAGLAYALSSVRCFTAASCRSHYSGHSWADRPVMFFAAERPTVHWLTPLVRDSGCGFADGSDRAARLLIVQAPSITNFVDLAQRIVEQVERQGPVEGKV